MKQRAFGTLSKENKKEKLVEMLSIIGVPGTVFEKLLAMVKTIRLDESALTTLYTLITQMITAITGGKMTKKALAWLQHELRVSETRKKITTREKTTKKNPEHILKKM